MNLKINLIACGLLFLGVVAQGQLSSYSYQRELVGVDKSWHKITLPQDVLSKANKRLKDLRIYGLQENGDTVEAPYFLRMLADKTVRKEVECNVINTSSSEEGYYYTFEVIGEESLNTIKLDFEEQNFDWKVRLEGSQNQEEWFTILKDHRIISIKNELTSFSFTTLTFPSAKYRFFRLLVPSGTRINLLRATIEQQERQEGDFRSLQFETKVIQEELSAKQTVIDLKLKERVHLNQLSIDVSDSFDYYRPVEISYLSDSFETEQGWKYQYRTIRNGFLNSFELNNFALNNISAKQLRVVVSNQDNKPLTIGDISAKGNVYELTTRLTEKATYYLAYGNEKAKQPQYDLARFMDNVPETIFPLVLGKEINNLKVMEQEDTSIFQNKLWLWAIMIVIILILGWFSVQMMGKTEKE